MQSTQKDMVMETKNATEQVTEYGILTQAAKYLAILEEEYEQAKKDVQAARSTYHHGLRDAMIARGYVVCYGGDNRIAFYGSSRLFQFVAAKGDTWRSPWVMSNKVMITFATYSWKEIYQYPCYYRDVNSIKIDIANFQKYYLSTCHDENGQIKLNLLKPYKTASEKAETYKSFDVFDSSDSNRCLGTFDNHKDAIKFAYDYAKEQCEKGKDSNLRRNYLRTPYDVTNKHVHYVAAYEYYLYDEHSYYIYVVGVTE